MSNTQGPLSTSEKSSQDVSEMEQGISAQAGSQPSLMEAQPSARKELPEVMPFLHIFSAHFSYSSPIFLNNMLNYAGPFHWDLCAKSITIPRLANWLTLWHGI